MPSQTPPDLKPITRSHQVIETLDQPVHSLAPGTETAPGESPAQPAARNSIIGSTRSPLRHYLVAVLAVALVAWIRFMLDPALGDHHPFIPFLAAVFLAVWAGGWKPGLLALLLGYLAADFFFTSPRYSLGANSVENQIGLIFYFFVGGMSLLLFEVFRQRTAELARANARLQRREAIALERVEAGMRRLANIVDSSDDAIIGKDLDSVVTDWNKGAEKLYGHRAQDVIGKHVAVLLPPDQREKWHEVEHKIKHGLPVEPFETIRLRKDGSNVEISLSVSPILEEGRLVGMSTISRDLTYTKRLEGELRQAIKMEAVGRLAGGVAHDFNNLLTIINGYSELLLARVDTEDCMTNMLTEIHNAGMRAEKLTKQLLAYSRKQILQPKILDINALVTDIKKMLHRMVGEDMKIVTSLEPELGAIKADPTQIEQIVINLAANSRDAMPQGGTLTIKTTNIDLDEWYPALHAGPRPGRYVMLETTDTGCGMSQFTKEHIFEPFFTTKEVGKGTGLGLAMVYGIVKQSEGYIEVESELGRGATFKVYLPRIEAIVERDESLLDAGPLPGGRETVLLVEDDAMVLTFTRTLLQTGGYRVLEATGGEEALKISDRYTAAINLLITDVVMPEMSGRLVAKRLTRSRPALKVLYLSGYTDDDILRHGVSVAEAAFLPKPFTPGALAHKVREVLDR